jgi:hypothetical protein
MSDEPAGDGLSASELVLAKGGQWWGLLFDNPTLGLPPELSWSFNFVFANVARDYGNSPVSIDVDWVLFATTNWQSMAGQAAYTDRFAEPTEASVYFFEHHRFEAVDLRILDQRGTAVQVAAQLSGDLDRLGIPSLAATGWLAFAGITVQLSTVTTAEAALARLQDFADVTDLSPSAGATPHSFQFRPRSGSPG